MPDDPNVQGIQPPHHRAGAWVVFVVGAIAFCIGAYQWRGQFSAAFAVSGASYKTPDQLEQERLKELKAKDTDADGINDFDETYVFKTSPYLDDSDSDGKTDKEELETGGNPNCPEGKQCGGEETYASATSSLDIGGFGEDVMQQLFNPSAAEIRRLLIQAGMKEEELRGVDDATLMQLYRQSLQEAQSKSITAPN